MPHAINFVFGSVAALCISNRFAVAGKSWGNSAKNTLLVLCREYVRNKGEDSPYNSYIIYPLNVHLIIRTPPPPSPPHPPEDVGPSLRN